MAPFRYEDYVNPYVGQTAGLMLRGPEAQARGAMEAAAARARASEIGGQAQAGAAIAGGQAWGGAIQQIGQSVAAIPGQIQQQKRQAIQDQLGTQQVEANRLGLQEQQQKRADMLKLDELFANGQGRDAVINAAPGHLRPQILKQYQEADKIGAEARTASEVARKAQQEHLGYLGAQIRQAEYDPATALAAIHQARDTYSDDPTMLQQIDTLRAHVIEQPESIKQIADAAILGSSYKDLLKPKAPIQRDPTKDLLNPDTLAVVSKGAPKVEKETRSLDVQAAAALAAGDTETYNRLLKVKKEMGQADDRPRITVNTGSDSNVKEAVAGMIDGTIPPQMPGKASKEYTATLAEAHRQGYDLKKAATDYAAVQKHVATLNGAKFTTLLSSVKTASESLDVIDDLAKKWDGGGFPILNKANLALAKGGAYGPGAASIATQLEGQITDVVSELGQVYMGGNSPTDHALKLAEKNLSASWDKQVLLDMTKLARTNLSIRRNSIVNSEPIFSNSKENVVPAPTTGGMIEAIDPQGNVHHAPAGTALPSGWKLK